MKLRVQQHRGRAAKAVASKSSPRLTRLYGLSAFWIRDFSMATDSGLVPPAEIRNHLRLVAKCQNGSQERALKSGAAIPPFAIPDHINFDGSPVFFPGTYSPGEDQGSGPWGKLPPVDDHYEFVHLAHNLIRQTGSSRILREEVDRLPLLERLERAFDAPETDGASGLVQTGEDRRAVGFGFCDAIVLTGKMLMPSLLRWRAAGELHELTGNPRYRQIRRKIEQSLAQTFRDQESGWLLAATGVGRQPDVWGTMAALDVLPERSHRDSARRAIAESYRNGTIAFEGAVRHVPTDRDFSKTSAWERTYVPKGSYQNGAYWHTASGLLFRSLGGVDRALARQAAGEYLTHLRTYDFRKAAPANGAPWECIGRDGDYRQNGAYLASAALPYAALRALRLA